MVADMSRLTIVHICANPSDLCLSVAYSPFAGSAPLREKYSNLRGEGERLLLERRAAVLESRAVAVGEVAHHFEGQ
jgi:hypothetical protein